MQLPGFPPNIKVSTTIDPTGSVNTTGHPLCILTVQKWILQQQNANLQIDISSPRIFSNNHVASCSVPLSHFQEMHSEGADTVKIISIPVCICSSVFSNRYMYADLQCSIYQKTGQVSQIAIVLYR